MLAAIAGVYLDEIRDIVTKSKPELETKQEPRSNPMPLPAPDAKAPSLKTLKQIVLGVAVILFILSCIKSYRDNRDKDFLQAALTSTLNPTNRYFNKIEAEINWEARRRRLDSRNCNHSSDGIICFFWAEGDTSKQATLVFDRVDMAEIYAAVIRNGHTRELIRDHFDHKYEPPTNELVKFHKGDSWAVFNTLDNEIRKGFGARSEKEIQENPAR